MAFNSFLISLLITGNAYKISYVPIKVSDLIDKHRFNVRIIIDCCCILEALYYGRSES